MEENKTSELSRTRTTSLIKDTMWFAIGNFGSKLLAFLLVPLYTNVLTPREYGVADIIFTTIELVIPIFLLSINDAVFRFAMEKDCNPGEVFNNGMTIAIVSPIVLFAFYPLLNWLIPSIGENWWLFWTIYIFNGFSSLFGNMLKATNHLKVFALQGIIQTFVSAVSNILCLCIFKLGIRGYLLSMLIGAVAAVIFMFFAGNLYRLVSFTCINKSLLKNMLRYSIPLIPASIAWWVMASIDKYMLLYMCGADSTGLYSIAHKIPTIISTVMTFFVSSWQIVAVREKDENDIGEYTSKLYNTLIILGIIATAFINVLSRPMAFILFKKDFFDAWTMSPSLCVSTLFSTLSLFLGSQFTAYKCSKLHLISNMIAMISNVAFNIVFILSFGQNGAALGTMFSFLITMIYRQIMVKRLINIRVEKRNFVAIFLLCASSVWVALVQKYSYFVCGMVLAICVAMFWKKLKAITIQFFSYLKKRKNKEIKYD